MDTPPRSSPWNYRLFCLILLAIGCFRLGVGYTPLSDPPTKLPDALTMITSPLPSATANWQPIWVFGAAWFVNGFAALFAMRRPLLHTTVYVAATVGMVYWGAAYLVAQFISEDKRSWFQAIIYFVVAGYIFVTGHFTRPKRAGKK